MNDGRAGQDALPNNPSEIFADRDCRGNHFRDAVRAIRAIPRVVAIGMRGRDKQMRAHSNGRTSFPFLSSTAERSPARRASTRLLIVAES